MYSTDPGTRERMEINERAATQNAGFGADGNPRTTRTYYASGFHTPESGRIKRVEYPDGRVDTYQYETGAPEETPVKESCHSLVASNDHRRVAGDRATAERAARESAR